MTIKPCRRKGLASLDCRDPMTYIKSNEAFQHTWTPYVKNLGGAYVGLGADQSYSFISLARSRWAWIFDYDPTVARIHHLIRAIVLRAETPVEFVDAFKKRNIKTTRAWIRESLAGDSEELAAVDETYRALRRRLYSHYYADMQMKSYAKGFGWLRYPKNYRYIRLMFRQGRIHAIMGNMLTAETLPRIAAAARALGVPIRIYYPSNAEEQWRLTHQYRENVIGLPFDKRSIVLRTLISEDFRRDDQSASYWHYIVHWGIDAQRKMRLKGYTNVNQFTADKIDTPLELLSLIRMPAYTETEELTASAGPAP
jgi:hypothetical protein